jgi:hypothetical protein
VLNKLLIPVFAFTVAASGCGGSSNNTTGGDGKTGAAGSTSGIAGATGAAGDSVGADAWTAGTGGSTADTSDGAAGADDALPGGTYPVCTVDTFCQLFIAYCGTTTPGYTTMDECMTTYAAVGAATPTKQQCETSHLCSAVFDTGDERTLHCGHAAGGGGLCDQTN